MVAAPCNERPGGEPAEPGGQRLRRRRREPDPRAALQEWEPDSAQTAGIRRIQTAVDKETCARITHAAIDMFEGYARAIRSRLPNATLIYDRFHVQQLVSSAVDEVRRDEWQRLRGTDEARGVKHLRWALLKNPWNVTPSQQERLAELPRLNRVLYRAYLLKESLAGIYRNLYTTPWAKRRLNEWITWASRSRLAPFRRVAATLRRCFEGCRISSATLSPERSRRAGPRPTRGR